MAALAAKRRKNGLAASVIHIGAIIGNGYVTRELTQAQQNLLRSYGNVWMSEQDFHQIFAEAVIASSPARSRSSSEIMTGLCDPEASDKERVVWSENPIFGHIRLRDNKTVTSTSSAKPGNIDLRSQLAGCSSLEAVFEMVQSGIMAKVKSLLQMNANESDSQLELLNVSLDAIGFDSLIAVDLRSWFVKELEIDVPVLKLMGSTTLAELISFVIERFPSTLIPLVPDGMTSIQEAASNGAGRDAAVDANAQQKSAKFKRLSG